MRIIETADQSKTLFSQAYQQTYHSDKGAVAESKHVFLQGSSIIEVLQTTAQASILEVGFGTGLNFFLTADVALGSKAQLYYIALEKNLLPVNIIQDLMYDPYLQHPEIIKAYLAFRQSLPEGLGHYVFEYQTLKLELRLGEAIEQTFKDDTFNAVYQDAFSPDTNPELWSELFSKKLFDALKPAGRLSTYSVKGDVRRTLQNVGFTVEKRPGPPGGKREMLVAIKPDMRHPEVLV
jgi:tRNA U34 5-methylaminomethyl-2-thiouridine-forming methyltransferase MnmC